jgi:hypothetical protein
LTFFKWSKGRPKLRPKINLNCYDLNLNLNIIQINDKISLISAETNLLTVFSKLLTVVLALIGSVEPVPNLFAELRDASHSS